MDRSFFEKYIDSNFFAYITTPLHIKGVQAAIVRLREQGIQIKGTVFVADHFLTGYAISPEDCPQIKDVEWVKVKYQDFVDYFSEYNIFRKVFLAIKGLYYSDNIYMFYPGQFSVGWLYTIPDAFKKHITMIIGDDGVGSYLGYGDLEEKSRAKNVVKSVLVKMLYRKDRVIDQRLLIPSGDIFMRNEKIAGVFERVLNSSGSALSPEIEHTFSGKILINTQCFYDNGQIDGTQDLDALKHLYDVLGKYNSRVIVKPHPRETSLHRYDIFPEWKIIPDLKISQEELFSKLNNKPILIFGITSSTLVNLRAIFGIKSISLVSFYQNECISDDEQNTCEAFISAFDGFVDIPRTDEELRTLIMSALEDR